MENSTVTNITENGKYHIQFEKAASANKIDGFKFDINGDDLDKIKREAAELYIWATNKVEMAKPIPEIKVPAVKA